MNFQRGQRLEATGKAGSRRVRFYGIGHRRLMLGFWLVDKPAPTAPRSVDEYEYVCRRTDVAG